MTPLSEHLSARRRGPIVITLGLVAIAFGGCPSNIIYPDGFFSDAADAAMPPFTEPIETKISVDGAKGLVEDFKTITPGATLNLKGEVTCPANALCSYAWDFGDGTQKNGIDSGKKIFPEGYYHVRLAVRNRVGDKLGEAHVYVAAWKGIFKDDFNRKAMDNDQRGWVKPAARDAEYVIKDDWLYVKHDLRAPGSTGLVAMPLMKNSHVEVTVRRYPHASEIHYMDVLFRVNPLKRETSFYRVRFDQSAEGAGSHLRIAVFKIFDDDQHGMLLSDLSQPVAPWDKLPTCKTLADCDPAAYTLSCLLGKCVPTGCKGCAKKTNFDPTRKQDFRIIIDFRDESGIPTWDVKAIDPNNPSTVFLEQKHIQDTTPNPHLYAGMVGLAHFDLETYYDDFSAERKD
ncbi:MAG: hypothetical protein KAI47_07250 [Deltaproteobacteria bacterium]|nr:hypothetical protein [Deltaproteobacteria bacterium]